jgi:hypothetical protein
VLAVVSALILIAAGLALGLHRQGGGEGGGTHERRRAQPAEPRQNPLAAPTAVASATPRPTVSRRQPARPDEPISTAGAAHAIAGFTPGFIAWSLGHTPATKIINATAGFIAQARAHPPALTPAERHERIRVARIRVLGGHPPVAVVDLTPSIGARYQLDFYLYRTRRGWLVSQLATPG